MQTFYHKKSYQNNPIEQFIYNIDINLKKLINFNITKIVNAIKEVVLPYFLII